MIRTAWAERRRARCGDRGAVIPFVALTMPVLIIMTAFAVDLGMQRSSRRTMQARADVIALDLVRLADGRTESQILPDAEAEKVRSANRNDIEPHKVTFEYGTWYPGFGFTGTLPDGVPNAVRVTAAEEVDWTFRPGKGSTSRSAIARTDAVAGFTIGSFAATVSSSNSPLLNRLLGNALGLGVLSYDGLATLNLDWLGIADDLGLGTPNELFTTDVTAFEAIEAAARIIQRANPNAAELEILNQILAVPNSPLRHVNVIDIVKVAAGAEQAALEAGVNLLDLVATSAFIANGEAGVTIPAVDLGLPGANVTGELNLIQRPQTVFGRVGDGTETSQAGLTASFNLGTDSLCHSITNLLGLLGGLVNNLLQLLNLGTACGLLGKIVAVDLQATLNVNLATATGTIARIGCGVPEELDIDVRSDLVTANLNVNAVVRTGSTVLTTFPLSASLGGGDFNGAADFVLPPDEYDVFKPVNPGSGALGLFPATLQVPGALGPLLTGTLSTVLNTVVPIIDSQIIKPLSELLGIRVASADVAPRMVDCNMAQLVG